LNAAILAFGQSLKFLNRLASSFRPGHRRTLV
jgi:hypothetical protein